MSCKVTIVICTYNRANLLDAALQSLVSQTMDKEFFSVIVVDNNSNDNTKDIYKKYSNILEISYLFEKKVGLSNARNLAIRESNTEYIGFMDDDAKADKNWIEQIIISINNTHAEIIGGPIYPFYDSKKPKWFKDKYESLEIDNISRYLKKGEYLYGSNIFIKKNIFKKIGFFDPDIGMKGSKVLMGEESKLQEMAYNQGIKIYYNYKMKVYHYVPVFKMKIKYIIKRYLKSAYISSAFIASDGYNKNLKTVIKNLIIIFILLLLFPVRDKKKYPYWQNYIIERFLHRIRFVFWLLRDVKIIRSKV